MKRITRHCWPPRICRYAFSSHCRLFLMPWWLFLRCRCPPPSLSLSPCWCHAMLLAAVDAADFSSLIFLLSDFCWFSSSLPLFFDFCWCLLIFWFSFLSRLIDSAAVILIALPIDAFLRVFDYFWYAAIIFAAMLSLFAYAVYWLRYALRHCCILSPCFLWGSFRAAFIFATIFFFRLLLRRRRFLASMLDFDAAFRLFLLSAAWFSIMLCAMRMRARAIDAFTPALCAMLI